MREDKGIQRYIGNIKYNTYLRDLITVEHRSNNNKRDYLFVNRIQGKHIPCNPQHTIEMFKGLADILNKRLIDKKVLVIGFAETATAIGNYIANNLKSSVYYLQTTRELYNYNKIEFKEEHSHAVEQFLYYKEDIINTGFNYILFIDDEITTGNTIINCKNLLEEHLRIENVGYGVASICNWQNENNRELFNKLKIETYSLIEGKIIDGIEMGVSDKDIDNTAIENIDTSQAKIVKLKGSENGENSIEFCSNTITLETENYKNERFGYDRYNTDSLIDNIINVLNIKDNSHNIRIIGTEEFMYIPLMVAYKLSLQGYNIKFQASTRSPIDILTNSKDSSREIVKKNKIRSAYDNDRSTYIYNIDNTDEIFIITDGEQLI